MALTVVVLWYFFLNIPDSSRPVKLSKTVIQIMKHSDCRAFYMDKKIKGNVPWDGSLRSFQRGKFQQKPEAKPLLSHFDVRPL